MHHIIYVIEVHLIPAFKKVSPVLARFSIATIFVWFGVIKVIGTSPATELVLALQARILPFLSGDFFVIILGVFEVMLGTLFILPHWERAAILLLMVHMVTTFLPLIFLPDIAWQSVLIPTLEGQYILKNLVVIALAIGIAAHLKPVRDA